ncbi:MAG: hypothetical protein A2Y24_03540 [Clostridiales bacterium GWE2_32_10]|nr:MAG: hypothetical protein A2Y24_03540 [Clostridiales bacterium GWE2_32_10]HBY20706.1 hypothetical protein [Clostridiales bacterium]
MLIQFTLKIFVLGYTFKESTIENSIVMKISILPQIFMLGSVDIREKNITENLYLIYIIAAIVIIIASYFIYKVRKVEKTGDVVVFRKLNPIVKYGITFCFMILIGLIVFLMFNDSIEYMISAYVITSVIAYFLAEMLIRKSVRVLDSYKGYSAYVVVMVIIFVGIKMDISGFESRVPDISNVDEVYYDQINNYGVQVVLREKLNKEAILAMHRLILSEKLSKKYRSIGANINLGYKLKNGKIMYREYIIDYTEEEQNAIENLEKIILGSQEYKKQVYEVFRDENVENISKIEISIDGSESKIYIDKKEEMQELLEVMRKDTLEMSYERMNNTHMLSGGISDVIKYVYIQEDSNQGTESRYKYKPKSKSETSINLYYNKSFKSTNNWLKQHNYYPNIQE